MKFTARPRTAFTLVEMIVVMAIIVVLVALSAPAITSMTRAKDVASVAYEISDALEQARTYAISNNTYVLFGITEVDGTKSVATIPQLYKPTTGGRVAIAIIASKDGTIGCSNPNDMATYWPMDYQQYKGSNFTVVRKLQVFDNVHMAPTINGAASYSPPLIGPMARPIAKTNANLGNMAGCPGADTRSGDGTVKVATSNGLPALNTFAWPLGSALQNGQFNFERVLTFDPQGVPRVYQSSHPTIGGWFEIDLQQARGNAIPTPPPNPSLGNQVAILISGTVGTNRIYRP